MNARATASARGSGQLATSAAMPSSAAFASTSPGVPCTSAAVEPASGDHAMTQLLHVVEEVLAAGLADDLAQYLAQQPDVAPHRGWHATGVGVSARGARGHCASVGDTA